MRASRGSGRAARVAVALMALLGSSAAGVLVAAPATADVRVVPRTVTLPAEVTVTATCPEPAGGPFHRATVRVPELGRVQVTGVVDGTVRTTLRLPATDGSVDRLTVRVRCVAPDGARAGAGSRTVEPVGAGDGDHDGDDAAGSAAAAEQDDEVPVAVPLAVLAVTVVVVFVGFGVLGRGGEPGQRRDGARRARR